MPCISGCCCFESLETGSRACSVFTLFTGIINIVIDIWLIITFHQLEESLEWNEKVIFLPPGVLAFIYIELACNLAVIVFAALLWVGINFRYEGRYLIFSWVWGMGITRIYQVFIMMYTLIWIGGHRVYDIVYIAPESLVVTIYWVLNSILLIVAFICVVSYWQQKTDEIEGREKRKRHFSRLTNIRAAGRTSGTATPSYRSWHASRSTLASAHPSVSMGPPPQQQYAYGHPVPKPHHYSTTSQGSIPQGKY